MNSLTSLLPLATLVLPLAAAPLAQGEGANTPAGGDAGQEEGAPARAVDRPFAVKFQWGLVGVVPVVETFKQGQLEVAVGYELRWTREKDGIVLRRSNLGYQTVNGIAADDPKLVPEVEKRLAVDLAVPPIRLDGTGRFQKYDPVNFKRMKKTLEKLRAEGRTALADQLEANLKDNTTGSAAKQKVREAWDLWFGLWEGASLRVGESMEAERPVAIGIGDHRFPAKVKATFLEGFEREGEKLVRWELTAVHEGEVFVQAMERVTAKAGGPKRPVRVGSRTLRIEGVFGAFTSRPYEITSSTKIQMIDAEGELKGVLEESRAFVFDWEKANVKGKNSAKRAKKGGGEGAQRARRQNSQGSGEHEGGGGGEGTGGGKGGETRKKGKG